MCTHQDVVKSVEQSLPDDRKEEADKVSQEIALSFLLSHAERIPARDSPQPASRGRIANGEREFVPVHQ